MKRFYISTILMASFSLNAQAAISTFDTSTEGWSALGDIAGPVVWEATGGNPGGDISITDAVTGGTTYFVAPSAFLGNISNALGSNLTFDLKQSYTGSPNQFDNSDIVLQGNGLTIAYNTANNPSNNAWTSYSIPLLSAGWKLNDLNGAAVSDAQFLSVLTNLTQLLIRAEFQTGPDTGYLDNVKLSAVPLPAGLLMFMTGLPFFATAFKRHKKPNHIKG